MIPLSFAVSRLKAWQQELQDIRLGKKMVRAASTGAASAAGSAAEAFAELHGVPPGVIVGLSAVFEMLKVLRER